MIPIKLTPQIAAPSPPPDARRLVTLQRTQTEQAIQDAASARVQTSSQDCEEDESNPLDGSSPPPDASGLELGSTRTLVSGTGAVAGDLNGGATCFDVEGRGSNATCPDRGSGFEVKITDTAVPGIEGVLATVAVPTPEVYTTHVVAGYDGAASMALPAAVAQFGAGAAGVQPGGRYGTLPAGAVSGVPSEVGVPLSLVGTSPVWPAQYALRTYWDGTAYSYRASWDLRTQPFLPITGAPVPTGFDFLSVSGRYGYAVVVSGWSSPSDVMEVLSFDLHTRTYLGSCAVTAGHHPFGPLAVSPNGLYALCPTYEWVASEPPDPGKWMERFSVVDGEVVTHDGSVDLVNRDVWHVCFATDGTAYAASARGGTSPTPAAILVFASPYTSFTDLPIGALFTPGNEQEFWYGSVVTPDQTQVLFNCIDKEPLPSTATSSGLVIMSLPGGSLQFLEVGTDESDIESYGVDVNPAGTIACVIGTKNATFVTAPFSSGSAVAKKVIDISDVNLVQALDDGSGFLVTAYPFHYVMEAPFSAYSPPWAVPADPYYVTVIAI